MTAKAEDAYELLRRLRMDLTDAQSKITGMFALLGELNIQDVPGVKCPSCGGEFRGGRTLSEHLYVSHNGPEPEHWKEAA